MARMVVGSVFLVVGIAGARSVPLAVGPSPRTAAAVIVLPVGASLVVTGYLQRRPIDRQLGVDTFRCTGR